MQLDSLHPLGKRQRSKTRSPPSRPVSKALGTLEHPGAPTLRGGKSGTNPARVQRPLPTRTRGASQIPAQHNEVSTRSPGCQTEVSRRSQNARNEPGGPARSGPHETRKERVSGSEERGDLPTQRVPGFPARAPAPGGPGSAPRGNRLGAVSGKLRAGRARGGALLTHAVLLLSLGGDPARHGGAGRSPREPPPLPPLLGQETLRLGRHLPFPPRRDRMGRKKFAAEAVSCGTGRAERRGPDGKRPGAPARGGTAARCSPPRRACIGLGPLRPSRDPDPCPEPADVLHSALCDPHPLLFAGHRAPRTLLCPHPAPLYSAPHPALIITYPALHMEHRAPCTAQRLCLCILRLWPRPLQPSRPRPNTNSGGLVQSQTPHTHSLLCGTPISVLVESAEAKLRVLRGAFIHSVKVKWAPILPGVEHAECTW